MKKIHYLDIMGRIKEKRRKEMYHVAVCEDEAVLRRELCGQCEVVLGEMQVSHRVTAFSSAEELEAALASGETFSLLCLDILMGGKNGMELARELRAREDETSILFITGSTEFLRDGYSVRPIQYLLTPVEPEALRRAIETDLRLHHRPHSVTFCAWGRTLVLPIGDILYAESRNHGCVLHTVRGEQFLPISLSQAEQTLPGDRFCRCHNSFLVDLSSIRQVNGRTLYLTDGTDLTIGRRYMDQFKNRFVRYLNQD